MRDPAPDIVERVANIRGVRGGGGRPSVAELRRPLRRARRDGAEKLEPFERRVADDISEGGAEIDDQA